MLFSWVKGKMQKYTSTGTDMQGNIVDWTKKTNASMFNCKTFPIKLMFSYSKRVLMKQFV